MFTKKLMLWSVNDKTKASLRPNLSPENYNLKLQADKINFEICSPDHIFIISRTHIAVRFNLRRFWPSVPSFAFGVIFKYSSTVLRV